MSAPDSENKEKILITATTFPLNETDSQPRFILNLARTLNQYYQTHVLVPRGKGARQQERIEGVNVTRYPYFFRSLESLVYGGGILENLKQSKAAYLQIPFLFLAQFLAVFSIVKREKIQLVNAHWIIPQGLIAILVKKLLIKNLKVVITSHGADLFSLRGKLLTRLKKWVLESADGVIVVSSAMKRFCYEEIKVKPQTDIQVRSMGVDLEQKFLLKRPFDKRSGLVFVGRLAEKKGLSVLLNALAKLKPLDDRLTLTVIGDGPERANLEQQSHDLGIQQSVSFVGAKLNDEIPELLNQYQVFVMPSIVSKSGDQEGLGLVAVEALGCGCAVIASDLPAIKDVISDGNNGLLFKAGEAESLAEKLRFLINDSEEARRLSDAGLQSAKETFDWQVVGKDYQAILKTVNKQAAK